MSASPRYGSGPPPPRLDHPRRVLVVGATGRLGVAIARAIARRGDRVALTARDPQKLAEVAGEVALLGQERPLVITADLRDQDAPERIAGELVRSGGVDDLVLASGPFPRTPLDRLRREDLEQTLMVHAIAPLLLVNALAEELGKRSGAVVALADAGVTRPYENHVAYLTAKGALQTGLRALAVELALHVRVNLVALGIVADPEADADPLRTHRLATRSPLGRPGTPGKAARCWRCWMRRGRRGRSGGSGGEAIERPRRCRSGGRVQQRWRRGYGGDFRRPRQVDGGAALAGRGGVRGAASGLCHQSALPTTIRDRGGSRAGLPRVRGGLLAVLEPGYQVRSNRESGKGRPDVIVRPMAAGKPGVVLELKVAKAGKKTLEQALDEGVAKSGCEAARFDGRSPRAAASRHGTLGLRSHPGA